MIRQIHRDQLRERTERYIDSGFGTPTPDRVVIVEIGPLENYDRIHISRAIHMTEKEIRENASSVIPSKSTEIILYCERGQEIRLWQAAILLSDQGYGNVFLYKDGKEDWLEQGLWTQTTDVLADKLPKVA